MPGNRALLAAALMVTACGRSSTGDAVAAERPTHVDSLVPREDALRRFQGAALPVRSLSGGAPTRDSLVRSFVTALASRDSSALRGMVIDRSEFAYLYYPTTPQGLPPYDLSPDLLWFLLRAGSDKGLGRALQHLGGRPMRFAGLECDSIPSHEGQNTVWGPCVVHYRGHGGGKGAGRLFGLILERDGTFKFVSYTNRL